MPLSHLEINRAYRRRHPDRVRASKRRWEESHRDRYLAIKRAAAKRYYIRHYERINQRQRAYYQEHRQEINARHKARRKGEYLAEHRHSHHGHQPRRLQKPHHAP